MMMSMISIKKIKKPKRDKVQSNKGREGKPASELRTNGTHKKVKLVRPRETKQLV